MIQSSLDHAIRIRDEFQDRYGPLPQAVENLVAIQRLKIQAGAQGIEEITGTRHGLDFFFAGGQEPDPVIIQGLMGSGPKGLQFKAIDQFIMKVPSAREDFLVVANVMLERLSELRARFSSATKNQ